VVPDLKPLDHLIILSTCLLSGEETGAGDRILQRFCGAVGSTAAGAVLVVGSGASGCQIADELLPRRGQGVPVR
jgi:hypothetical protein